MHIGTILDFTEDDPEHGNSSGVESRVEILVRDSAIGFTREVVSPDPPTQITHRQADFGERRVTSVDESPIAFEHLLTVLGHQIGPLLVVADIGQWEPRDFEHDEEIAGILGEHGAAQIERPLWTQTAATEIERAAESIPVLVFHVMRLYIFCHESLIARLSGSVEAASSSHPGG
jgi:hypothetical protein